MHIVGSSTSRFPNRWILSSLREMYLNGLIEEQEGRWLPVPVTAKQDLASAPVLQKLAELAKQA